jgi:hypothetical protein
LYFKRILGLSLVRRLVALPFNENAADRIVLQELVEHRHDRALGLLDHAFSERESTATLEKAHVREVSGGAAHRELVKLRAGREEFTGS